MTITGDNGSCALAHISGLSPFGADPAKAMLTFCQKLEKERGTKFGTAKPEFTCTTFYVFNGATFRGGKDVPYATKFAEFIRDNKLGGVTGSVSRANRQYTDGHLVRVWVWAPDSAALYTWFKSQKA